MKFKHTFHVFVDNFAVTYKQLLYRLVIALIGIGITAAILTPFIRALTGSPDYISLTEAVKSFLKNLVEGKPDSVGAATEKIKQSFSALMNLISENSANIVWGVVGVIAVNLVKNFFAGLGNYATAAVINDKMALHANSPFLITLIRNLKEASLYNLMYVPLSFLYDAACVSVLYLLIFKLVALIPIVYLPIQVFLFVTLIVIAISIKMTMTTDWLPALIRGKMGQGKAFVYTFDRRRKRTLNVLSNFVILVLIIFALNVGAILCTFGVAGLITIPSSYVILLSFEFVNYYDREELKYFIDKKTIIKPERERTLTREEFFKGE